MGYIMSISMCMQNFITIFHSIQEGHFHFFRIWNSAKNRPMKNVISQSLGLDLVNINVYANVYQNIPLSSRERATFTFSKFEPRQRKILSKYSKRFKSYRPFSTFFTNRPASSSLFQNLNLGNASANPK